MGEVVAYSTAEEYDVHALQRRLADAGYSAPMYNVLGEAIWVPQWSPRLLITQDQTDLDPGEKVNSRSTGEIFVFESG